MVLRRTVHPETGKLRVQSPNGASKDCNNFSQCLSAGHSVFRAGIEAGGGYIIQWCRGLHCFFPLGTWVKCRGQIYIHCIALICSAFHTKNRSLFFVGIHIQLYRYIAKTTSGMCAGKKCFNRDPIHCRAPTTACALGSFEPKEGLAFKGHMCNKNPSFSNACCEKVGA